MTETTNDTPRRALTKADIVATAGTLPYEDMEVPEWGGWVRVQGLSGRERDAYEASVLVLRTGRNGRLQEGRDMDNVRSKLLVRCLRDLDGNRLFADHEYDELGALDARPIVRLWEKAQTLSGLSDDDVQELVEGFGETPEGSSTSP